MSVTKKPVASAPAPKRKRFTFWVTRDSDPKTGAPYPAVKMWLAYPKRVPLERGAFWVAREHTDAFYAACSLTDAIFHAKGYPDDDRQCIRVDGDIEWQLGIPVNRPGVS